MKINNPTKFFPEGTTAANYDAIKNRSTIMTRGDVIRKFAEYDSVTESEWHTVEDPEKDSWVKFSFDAGRTYPLKFRFKNTLLMKLLKNDVPAMSSELEFDFSGYSDLDYVSIKNGRVSLYAVSTDEYYTNLPFFRYKFDDDTKKLKVISLMDSPDDTAKTMLMIELDGHSAMAMAVPTPVFSSFVWFTTAEYNEELGWVGLLGDGHSELTANANFDSVTKLYLKVRSVDDSATGNIVVRIQCGSAEAFTSVVPVTGTEVWQEIDLTGHTPLNGTLHIERVMNDSRDTLGDVDVAITNVKIDIFG